MSNLPYHLSSSCKVIKSIILFSECHAELNAVLNRNSADLKNSTMYVSNFPCNECAKIIIQSGIKSVVYYADKKEKAEATQKEKNDKCKDPPNLMPQILSNHIFNCGGQY